MSSNKFKNNVGKDKDRPVYNDLFLRWLLNNIRIKFVRDMKIVIKMNI